MEQLKFDLRQEGSAFKLLNATNGGPWHKRHANDQLRSNFADYKAARIPYSRNHDSAVCGVYGGPYSHDIAYIFPNFDADPTDPASYDFPCTDEAIFVCEDAGTRTFFRLGQTIEHQIKKHGTIPPKDFHKWAVICEHIIRHYTEGWADGFHLDMPYWEIWNEADLDTDDSTNKRTWGGTKAEFFRFYEVASKHLKACFPHLKIGGPALAGNEEWADDFLAMVKETGSPMDFFSWHIYCIVPEHMTMKAERIQAMLEKYGLGDAEQILNEWNYVKGWEEEYIYSIKAMHSIKGAAFALGCICEAQHSDIDMLMYYDTRPSCFNGAFDFYTYEKLPGYYALYWYGMFYDMVKEIPATNKLENIYSLCGVDKDGKVTAVVTYYTDDDTAENKQVKLDFGRPGKYEIYLVDGTKMGEKVATTEDLTLDLKRWDMVLVKEI